MPSRRGGFDAVRALRNRTGLGNYSRGVLGALRQHDPRMRMHLYSPLAARTEFSEVPGDLGAELHLAPATILPGARAIWRTFRSGHAAARHGVEFFHGLTHEIPRDLPGTGVRAIVTFHDLIYLKHPELFAAFDRWSYRWRYDWSARHADAVIAVSARTRDDLLEHYRLDASRIAVIPPPRNAAFALSATAAERAATRSRYAIPGEFLLSVGTLEPRKNHRVLVAAMARLRVSNAMPLLLIGRDGGSGTMLRTMIADHGLSERVRILSDVSSADLPTVMQSAALFLYPSLIEGFGMPIVEAQSGGVPVIAAQGGHLDEAGGPDARYVPANDPDAWAAAIGELLTDSDGSARMRQQGRTYATRFDGDRLAARLVAVYDAVVAGTSLP
ncbi:MAG: glycosyltransferase family 4 protein [Gemmatimonadales bacterium]